MLKSELEKENLLWKDRVREEVGKNKNLQQTIEHLDKVLCEKELELRDFRQAYNRLYHRNDALQTALTSMVFDLRDSQTKHEFKPGNENRFEFKNGKWGIKETKDEVSLAG